MDPGGNSIAVATLLVAIIAALIAALAAWYAGSQAGAAKRSAKSAEDQARAAVEATRTTRRAFALQELGLMRDLLKDIEAVNGGLTVAFRGLAVAVVNIDPHVAALKEGCQRIQQTDVDLGEAFNAKRQHFADLAQALCAIAGLAFQAKFRDPGNEDHTRDGRLQEMGELGSELAGELRARCASLKAEIGIGR